MRDADPSALATLASGQYATALLISMALTEPLHLTTAAYDIDWDGETYIGAGNLVSVEPVKDGGNGNEALQFTLSGATAGLVAIARQEPIKGKRVRVRQAFFDATTHAVLDAPLIWSGTLDQMPIRMAAGDGTTASVGVTAQHRGVTFGRPKPLRYTDADQQLLHPGDTSLRFINSQAGTRIVWPAAAFFAQ